MSHPGHNGRKRALFIGRYFDIEFYLDYSWFLIAAVVSASLTANFRDFVEGQASGVYVAMGILAAFLFFLSILLHELGHSLVSQRCGIPVPRITLMLIGGVAEIAREPDDARSELKIALGGPLVSLALVVIYFALSELFAWMNWEPGSAVCWWLSAANLFLLVFNMIPGYPLDGGRVLRAIIWARSGRLRYSTFITSRIGIGFSGVLAALGFLLLGMGKWNGMVLFVIAIFLKRAADSGYANAVEREVLAGVLVGDIMTPHPIALSSTSRLNRVVDEFFLAGHQLICPVCSDDGDFRGFLRLDTILEVPLEKWPYSSAGDLDIGDFEQATLTVDQPAGIAMRALFRSPADGRLAVLEEGKLVGILTQQDLSQAIAVRSKLETRLAK
ncbi:MAG: Zinc metalloprotease [Chthoniobacteraceae bacterium]|nr:Zinc metalloprotease [Chthoniobacteraceae bacterium]